MRSEPKWLKIYSAFLVLAAGVFGQSSDAPPVTKYTLYDVGTLGGNYSGFYNADQTGDDFSPRALNQRGQLAGASLFSNDVTAGSFLWSRGKLSNLPTLPHGNEFGGGSNAFSVNGFGLVAGASSYGLVDPSNNTLYYQAVTWTGGKVQDLGDFGGHDSWANFVNDQGLVVGYAYNTTPDPYSFYGNQYHATTWLNGKIADLGTLGGNDSEAWTGNSKGDVIGISFLNAIPIPPFNQPQDDAFLWSDGAMTDLGTLGGVFSTPSAVNENKQVTVISYDASNQFVESYLWNRGTKTVLGSLGGSFIEALTLNDSGVSAGTATTAGDVNFVAGAWTPDGSGKTLGTVSGDTGSIAFGINNHGVIVGGSGSVTLTAAASYVHAFVWQNGKLQDLNTLIPAGSPLTLNVAYAINEAGVIAGEGTNSAGDMHAFVLVPDSTWTGAPFATAATAPAAPGSQVAASNPLMNFARPPHGVNNR